MKFQRWMVISGLLPFFYRHFNFSPRFLYKIGWGSSACFPKERHLAYIRQFPTKNDRSGTISFLKSLFNFSEHTWQQCARLADIRHIKTQIVWGCADKLVSARNLDRWKKLLPNAQIIELRDVGHFVAEEAPLILVKAVENQLEEIK